MLRGGAGVLLRVAAWLQHPFPWGRGCGTLGTQVLKGPHPGGCCVPSGQGRCWKPSPADTLSLAYFN